MGGSQTTKYSHPLMCSMTIWALTLAHDGAEHFSADTEEVIHSDDMSSALWKICSGWRIVESKCEAWISVIEIDRKSAYSDTSMMATIRHHQATLASDTLAPSIVCKFFSCLINLPALRVFDASCQQPSLINLPESVRLKRAYAL